MGNIPVAVIAAAQSAVLNHILMDSEARGQTGCSTKAPSDAVTAVFDKVASGKDFE